MYNTVQHERQLHYRAALQYGAHHSVISAVYLLHITAHISVTHGAMYTSMLGMCVHIMHAYTCTCQPLHSSLTVAPWSSPAL